MTMLAYLKFELRRMYREPRLFIFTIAMPVILFLALSPGITSGAKNPQEGVKKQFGHRAKRSAGVHRKVCSSTKRDVGVAWSAGVPGYSTARTDGGLFASRSTASA